VNFAIGGRPGAAWLAGYSYDDGEGWYLCSNLIPNWIMTWHHKPHYRGWSVHGKIRRPGFLLLLAPRFSIEFDW
jgi:hypothetical protein